MLWHDLFRPIHVLILNNFSDELRAAATESGDSIVNVLHGEHDAEVAESVYWGAAMVCHHRRCEEAGQLEPAMAVRGTHHGNLDAHAGQTGDAICPVSFNRGASLEFKAKFNEKVDGVARRTFARGRILFGDTAGRSRCRCTLTRIKGSASDQCPPEGTAPDAWPCDPRHR